MNYCPICGVKLTRGHRCSKSFLARRDAAMSADVPREHFPTVRERLKDGFLMMRDDDMSTDGRGSEKSY